MLIYVSAHPRIDGDGTGSEVRSAIVDNAADLASAAVVNGEVRNDDAPATETVTGASTRCRQRPTLPRSRDRSTIGAAWLNDRVRDGNGCGPSALVASEFSRSDGIGGRSPSDKRRGK